MNALLSWMMFVQFIFCASAEEKKYTGSTPAGATVRTFLGIPVADSIDFIRWKFRVQDDRYSIQCNYGISKPNTNGFMNGGKWMTLQGTLEKKDNKYRLNSGSKALDMYVLNNDLLHLMDEQNHLLVGNDGWSYTLSNEAPTTSDQLNVVVPKQGQLRDSMIFQGRTPCLPFRYERQSPNCYKLKWSIAFYADSKTNKPTTYYLKGTAVNHERRSGTWSIGEGKDGKLFYKLQSSNHEVLQLAVLDENLIAFTDQQGNLLPGNEDFSFTLNKKKTITNSR